MQLSKSLAPFPSRAWTIFGAKPWHTQSLTLQTSDSQAVANHSAVNVLHVRQTAVAQDNAVFCNEVSLFEEQQVHAWGWSVIRAITRRVHGDWNSP